MRVAVFASGRGSNFEALLESAQSPGFPAQLVLLVSDRANAAALQTAANAGLETFTFDPGSRRGEWSAEAVAAVRGALATHDIELICLAGFLRILPAELVRAFPDRIVNIHPSLLPLFPGLYPHAQALRAGVKVSGCTVHLVDDGVDTGPILAQASVPVLPHDDEESLAARVLEQEHRLYSEVVRAFGEGRVHVEGRLAHIHSGVSS